MNALFIATTFYVLLGTGAIALYVAVSGRRRVLNEKLEDLAVEARVSRGLFETRRGEADGLAQMLLRWAARRVPAPRVDSRKVEKLVQTLVQAGYMRSSAVRTFQLVRVCCSVFGTVVALVVALFVGSFGSMLVIWIIAGAAVGAAAPTYYISRRAHARQAQIARELSDVLDLLVVCVEAELGLHEAIKVVGSEVERQGQVIGRELSLVSAEMAAGRSLGQALRAFADRTAVEDLRPLAATLIQSEQLGAQIAPALRSSSDMLRSRRRLRAEELAAVELRGHARAPRPTTRSGNVAGRVAIARSPPERHRR